MSETWLRQQALAQRAARDKEAKAVAADPTQAAQARKFLTELLTKIMLQQQRLLRLSLAYADRCDRVHELSGLYRGEWERANALEGEVQELRAQLSAVTSQTRLRTVVGT